MNKEYIYIKTNDVQKDMHDFVSQFGNEIAYISYPENIIKLKSNIIYRFTYTLVGIRKYYLYTEVCNYHLKFQNKNLQQENKQLKTQLEESKKLREIIDNVRLYINDMIKTYEQRIEIETDMSFGDKCKKIKCYKEFNRKLTNLKKELDILDIDKGK